MVKQVQTWPPQPSPPEAPASLGQRLTYCHSSSQFTMPLAAVAIIGWITFWLVTPGLDHRWTVLAVLAVLPLSLGAAAGWALWRSWREAALGRDGVAAAGEAVSIREGRGSSPIITVYRIEYRFCDAEDRPFTGRLRTQKPTRWMFYKGEPLDVRYDPRRPERNTLRHI